jgi:GT2 family glycosyltransferase
MPTISVIIPTWNGLKHLPTCFEALQAQTFTDFETILVDNASSDESVSQTKSNYPWVKVVQLPHNMGFTGAINAGIEAAQGEFLVLLNNDTEATPGWLEAIFSAFAGQPQVGSVASKILLFDERHLIHSAGDGVGVDGIPLNRGVWQADEGQFDQDTFIWGGCGGAVAYRQSALEAVGVLDEDLFMYCEDVDLNWRLQLAGYTCVFAPQAVVYHHLSATGGGEIASYYTGRNTILVLVKSLPTYLWRSYYPQIISAQLKIAWSALRAWRGTAARARLRGQLVALLHIPRWLGKRKQVQATQAVSDAYLASLIEKP